MPPSSSHSSSSPTSSASHSSSSHSSGCNPVTRAYYSYTDSAARYISRGPAFNSMRSERARTCCSLQIKGARFRSPLHPVAIEGTKYFSLPTVKRYKVFYLCVYLCICKTECTPMQAPKVSPRKSRRQGNCCPLRHQQLRAVRKLFPSNLLVLLGIMNQPGNSRTSDPHLPAA